MVSKQTLLLGICIGVGAVLAFFVLKNTAVAPTNTERLIAPSEVTSYVKVHISELSPVHEQLGGTFYVTAIDAQSGAGTVSYEDGHNAYTADFTYSVTAAKTVRIDSFIVR